MLKVLEDLEKAVERLLEGSGRGETVHPANGSESGHLKDPGTGLETDGADRDTEEAAELIRRAIKRLRSL